MRDSSGNERFKLANMGDSLWLEQIRQKGLKGVGASFSLVFTNKICEKKGLEPAKIERSTANGDTLYHPAWVWIQICLYKNGTLGLQTTWPIADKPFTWFELGNTCEERFHLFLGRILWEYCICEPFMFLSTCKSDAYTYWHVGWIYSLYNPSFHESLNANEQFGTWFPSWTWPLVSISDFMLWM